MPGSCCEVADHAFAEQQARDDARLYRRRGASGQTRQLLIAIRSTGMKDATLLDIGGGIGAIHHELLQDVVRSAVHVDASSAYLKEARAEAARLGHEDRVTFLHADFTDAESDLPRSDIVTLDRVVCCYPDFPRLLRGAAGRSRGLLAMTYPRDTWYMRLGLAIVNAFQRLRRDPFRTYLHSISAMDALLRGEGLRRVFHKRLFVWEVAVYNRA